MSRRVSPPVAVLAALTILFAMPTIGAPRAAERAPMAAVLAGSARVDFVPNVRAEGFVLSVSGPDGSVERQEFDSGRAIVFGVAGPDGKSRPDGVYNYELRARRPAATAAFAPVDGPESPDGRAGEAEAAVRSRPAALEESVQSGSFRIQGGLIVAGGATEARSARDSSPGSASPAGSGRTPNASGRTALDQVIPDDLIVQGSACFGFDCVNGESFGFDTIRLKENNTRIKFEDTSVGSFPTNEWQLTANDSASGGAEKFSIEDITGAKIPFTLTAGAATNSLFVDSTGRVGFRTATPVLDLHVNTSNTPALRLEQNNGGGFTAQTWDVAGNEANFFIRDVTGGSRLPFRIRPGALTSSIDIGPNGVGIGIASPAGSLDLNTPPGVQMNYYFGQGGLRRWRFVVNNADPNLYIWDQTAAAYRLTVMSGTGYVGIGLTNPSNPLHMGSGAHVTAGGVWTNASSREYKQNIEDLSPEAAEETLAQLNPVTYAYKAAPAEQHVGFIAEDVPALLATADRKGMSPMDVAAVLTKVVQEQQKTIKELSERLARVEAAGK